MWPEKQVQTTGQYSNGGTAKASVIPTMPLDDLSKQLEEARGRISSITARAKATADVLFGSEPEGKTGGNDAKPQPFGKLGSLTDQAQIIHFALNELERQIGRLNPLG